MAVTIAEAERESITWKQLQSRRWQRLARGVYVPARGGVAPLLELGAAWRRMPPDAVLSFGTAGWLHGLDLSPCAPIEVSVAAGHAVSHRAGVRFHKVQLDPAEVVVRHGFRVTSPLRTCADLGSVRDQTAAVTALDMALNNGLASKAELAELAEAWTGRSGVVKLRRAVALADVAESPMETRLRLLLVRAGLPAPEPQVTVTDGSGGPVARVDLYYASHRLCIEFDGGQHRDQLVADNRRQNRLVDAGYSVLRFTSADVLGTPERIAAVVRAALARPAAADFARNRLSNARRSGHFARNRPVVA
jgi:uncharacterized protein DUF559